MSGVLDGVLGLLMLADSRLPAGGHAHSGGVEAAIETGMVGGLADLAVFLRGRLRTAGAVAAGLAAAACRAAAVGPAGPAGPVGPAGWAGLDAEADARTPSPAQRRASRQQGRALLRAARPAWPSPALAALAGTPGGPHHPIVLGTVTAAAGGDPEGAALVAAYLAVSGPATAAVRLRGMDPLAVHALLAGLAGEIAAVARRAAVPAGWPDLPSPTAPRLDLLAERHARSEVRLFAS
ncbi:MAG TPA: urease accessory UreF family protein [Mycobacteriales bacterium]|nr:urease accessory UreF family protein [Mycobacteriales bacterium]